MPPKETRRFLYDASGLAIGGRITRPFNEVVEATAAVALPISGGHGTSRIDGFAYRNLVTFKSGVTTVAGSETGEHWNTSVTVEIEGLNVMGVVTADRIVARLSSERAKSEPSGGEVPILPAGSYFDNLRIGGARVKTRIASRFAENATFSAILGGPKAEGSRLAPAARPAAELVGLPLFECELESSGAEAQLTPEGSHGVAISVPGFGRVFVGELFMTARSRRLNMLRLELGSPVEGEIVVAGAGGNGNPYP